MAADNRKAKIIHRDNDDLSTSEQSALVIADDGDGDGDGDPWKEMNLEQQDREQKERELKRRAKKNDLLGIVDQGQQALNGDVEDDTGLVVPIKNLVTFAGRGRDIKERRQSAFGFAHFSMEQSTQQQITEFENDYGIDALLSLLQSDDAVCRRYSALALGNIVSNAKFCGKCVEYGVLEAMLPLAIDDETDLETRRYCMLAVANMAAQRATHRIILASLDGVVVLLDSLDEELQKCATLCVQNLSTNAEVVMALEACIQPLVNLLSITRDKSSQHVPLSDAKLHSVAALRGLCVVDVLRLRIINEGILRSFLYLIDTPPSTAILVEIAAILCGFSSLYETHVDLLQPAVLHSIFLLAMGDLVEAQQFASTALANLASNSATHDRLVDDANAIANLLVMCEYADRQVQCAATRALANFAANGKRHQQLLDAGCLKKMIAVLNVCDAEVNMFSALFFSILCENRSLHGAVCSAQVIQPLFHFVVARSSGSSCKSIEDTSSSSGSKLETVRYSVLALANLASSPYAHAFILSEIEIQSNAFFSLIVSCENDTTAVAYSGDAEIVRYFALLLSNLAENVNSHELLSSLGTLRKIERLLHREADDDEVILNVLSFVLKLLATKLDAIRVRVGSVFCEALVSHLYPRWTARNTARARAPRNDACANDTNSENSSEELFFMLAAFFSNISTSEVLRKQLQWHAIVPLLSGLFSSHTHRDIQTHAINAMANLRDVPAAVSVMVHEDAVLSTILSAMQSTQIDIHSSSLRLLSGITSHAIAIDKLRRLGCVHLIAPFVRSPHIAFRKYAYVCLANYASHASDAASFDLQDINLIKCYLNMVLDEHCDVEEMRCCLFALANIAYHAHNVDVIADSGVLIMKSLLDYVACKDVVIDEYASLLLYNCSVHPTLAVHSMFSYHDIVEMILNFAFSSASASATSGGGEESNKPNVIILNALKCLQNLAYYDTHVEILLDCRVVEFVVQFIQTRKLHNFHENASAIDLHCAALVYNLSSHPAAVQRVARHDLILAVSSLLVSTLSETRAHAANALACVAMQIDVGTPLFLLHGTSGGGSGGDVLQFILAALKYDDDVELYHALAITLGYIFSLPQIQTGACHKLTRTQILSLLRRPNRQIQLAALWATSTGSTHIIMRDEEMLQIIAKLAEPPQTQADDSGEDSPLLLKIIRRRALITLVNYAKDEDHHALIIANCTSVISHAFHLHECNDLEVILLSAMLLSNLSHSLRAPLHEQLIGDHDIAALDLYLGYQNDNIQIFAVRTLAALVNTDKFAKKLIVSEKIVPLLCLTTLRGNAALNQEIALLFQNLTRHSKYIGVVLEQHLIPTLVELLKNKSSCQDAILRLRIVSALKNCANCCLHETMKRVLEVEKNTKFLWDLLLPPSTSASEAEEEEQKQAEVVSDEREAENSNSKKTFVSAVIHILSLCTQLQKTAAFEVDIAHDLLSSSSSCDDEMTRVAAKKRLRALLNVIFECDDAAQKVCIAKILKCLTLSGENDVSDDDDDDGMRMRMHELLMSEDLKSKKDDEISLSYLTIYALFYILETDDDGNDADGDTELVELSLTILSQICVYPAAASKLLQFNTVQNRFDIIAQLQTYGNHASVSIRTLSLNVCAYVMQFIQKLIVARTAASDEKLNEYLRRFYLQPSTTTSIQLRDHPPRRAAAAGRRLNGLSLIQRNGKIADLGLQAQSARLLAIFSSVEVDMYADLLNRDDMYALLFWLSEQAWHSDQVPSAASTPYKLQCAHTIHQSVASCLSNMVLALRREFVPESTTLMPVILRYLKHADAHIRSLALICVAGVGKREIAPLFQVCESPSALLLGVLQDADTDADTCSNVMKALILISKNAKHLKFVLQKSGSELCMFEILIAYAQNADANVAYLALTALKNMIACTEWQQQQQMHSMSLRQSLLQMLVFQFEGRKSEKECPKIRNLVLIITSYIAKISQFQSPLISTVAQYLIDKIVLNDECVSQQKFLAMLSLYHLSITATAEAEAEADANDQSSVSENVSENIQTLLDAKLIEAALYLIITHAHSVKHCYIALACIANLCTFQRSSLRRKDVHPTTQQQQKILPTLTLETLHEIAMSMQTSSSAPPQKGSDDDDDVQIETTTTTYALQSAESVQSLIALIAARMTSRTEFELTSIDLCYLNTILYHFSACSHHFYTQTYALITLLNFLHKCNASNFKKIIAARAWLTTLLCFTQSTNLSVTNMILKCVLRILQQSVHHETPHLLRMLDELCCNPHFVALIELTFKQAQQNQYTLVALSQLLLIVCQHMPMHTLLMYDHRSLLLALIEFTLHSHATIKHNGCAALHSFVAYAFRKNDTHIPFKILSIASDSEQPQRGLLALFELLSSKAHYAETMHALSTLSANTSFVAQQFVPHNGLSIIIHEVLHNISMTHEIETAIKAAEILRNVCKNASNVKLFLAGNGCQCLMRLIDAKSATLRFSAAAILADIVYQTTSATSGGDADGGDNSAPQSQDLFVFTVEHLTPFMADIVHCLLQLLRAENASEIHDAAENQEQHLRKMTRVCLTLLHRLSCDSELCQTLMVRAEGVRLLVTKWLECVKHRFAEHEIALAILKCVALCSETQKAFVEQNGGVVLKHLVHDATDKNVKNQNHNNAAVMVAALARNVETHALLVTHKIYKLLLILRHSPNNDARKTSMDTLLTLLENQQIHGLLHNDVELSQTLAAISKFGGSKQIKQRATKIMKKMAANDSTNNKQQTLTTTDETTAFWNDQQADPDDDDDELNIEQITKNEENVTVNSNQYNDIEKDIKNEA